MTSLDIVTMKRRFLALLSFSSIPLIVNCFAWTPAVTRTTAFTRPQPTASTIRLQAAEDSKDDVDDWRKFRANLVLQDLIEENGDSIENNKDAAKTSSKSWAYEAGTLIEKGSIILSRVESSLGCHDLRQPYFHKCAVLVLEHDEDSTRGIILNRPSNLICSDGDILLLEEDDDDDEQRVDPNPENAWPMSFGGDIAGLFSDEPMIVALHSMNKDNDSAAARTCSDEILPGLWVTSHSGARSLVASGEATCEDFYSFYGFSLWDPGMLQREVDRGSWYIVSMDSGTVLETLRELRQQNNPQAAGLPCWEDWTRRIHKTKEERVEESRDAFSDLMLKEWCQEMLCVENEEENDDDDDDGDEYSLANLNMFEAMEEKTTVGPGSLVRASNDPLTYMLFDQLFHKSTVLLLKEEEELSLGLILNLPTIDAYIHTLPDGTKATIPIRYGGSLGHEVENDDTENEALNLEQGSCIIWLHCNTQLREMSVGKSISDSDPMATQSPIWTCSQIQALNAMDMGLAKPSDFLAVQGYVVWEKEMGVGGIAGELFSGRFQPVAMNKVHDMWTVLGSQSQLQNLEDVEATFLTTRKAWEMSKPEGEDVAAFTGQSTKESPPRVVHGTDVLIPDFSDDALKKWIQIFLLDDRKYVPF